MNSIWLVKISIDTMNVLQALDSKKHRRKSFGMLSVGFGMSMDPEKSWSVLDLERDV